MKPDLQFATMETKPLSSLAAAQAAKQQPDASQSNETQSATAESATAERPSAEAAPSEGKDKVAPKIGAVILRVAWMSILLGVTIEIIIIIIALSFGKAGNVKPFIADLVQKITWAKIVCVGIAFGTAVSKMRVPVMGILGLLAAPVAFTVARSFQKGVAEALSVAGGATGGPSPLLMGLIKGVEYALLGAIVGWISKKQWGGVSAHIGAGLIIGTIFGALIIGVNIWTSASPLTPPEILSKTVNEVVFPVGCSLVLFAAKGVEKLVAR